MNGQITNLQRFSVKDGPGIRTTVFLKGCPLKCQWCHNPETQHAQREYGLQQALCVGCRACAGVCTNGAHRFSPDGAHRFDPSACALCGACTRVCPAGAIQLYGKSVSAEAVMQTVLRDKQQDTVDYIAKKDAQLSIHGRHDPCIVPRAAIVQTCAAALAVGDLLTARYGARWMTDPTGYRKED